MATARLEIGATLREMRASFEENRPLIVKVTLLFAVLAAVTTVFDVTGTAGVAIWFGITILLGAAYGGMITSLLCLPGKSEDAGDLWAKTKPALARLIWVALIASVAAIAGLFALIIPGLVIATIWSVAGQAVLAEGKSVFESLGRSRQLVRNNGLRVFGFLIVIGLFSVVMLALALLVSAPLGDGLAGRAVSNFLIDLLSTPIVAIGTAVLYNRLIVLERENQAPEAPEEDHSGLAPPPKD